MELVAVFLIVVVYMLGFLLLSFILKEAIYIFNPIFFFVK